MHFVIGCRVSCTRKWSANASQSIPLGSKAGQREQTDGCISKVKRKLNHMGHRVGMWAYA